MLAVYWRQTEEEYAKMYFLYRAPICANWFYFAIDRLCSCQKIETIKLPINSADQVEAIYGVPEGEGKFPAIIYNHGTFVRRLGYSEAARRGYDVRDFVNSLVQNGFVALAPIRKIGRLKLTDIEKADIMDESPYELTNALKEGIAITSSAIQFLKSQPTVQEDKIGIIGFSEGGLITLWSSFEQQQLKAIVLMSPADIKKSSEFCFREACKKVETIKAPVLLTLVNSVQRTPLTGRR